MNPYLIAAIVAAATLWHLFVVPFVLWVLYLASTHLDKIRVQGQLSPRARQLGTLVLGITAVIDVYANLTSATLWFLDLPRDATVTQRLKRYLRGPYTWRARIADDLGWDLLNVFDRTGNHLD